MTILAWVLLSFMIGLLVGLGLYVVIGACIYHTIFARKGKIKRAIERKKNSQEEIDFWSKHDFKDVMITSFDGLKLRGKFLNNGSQCVAFLVHGYGGNYVDMAKYADIFLKRGLDVLAVDNRAHGTSEGDYVGMGWIDRLDVIKWCEFLSQEKPYSKVLLFGQSMGASAVCMASCEKLDCHVVGIIEDCGFDNTFKEVSYIYQKGKLHTKFFLNLFTSYANRKNGYDMRQADAIRQLKKTSLPILIIHGSDDDFVPTEMAYNIYNNLDERRRNLYIASGAKHTESYDVDKKKYIKAINKFLDKEHIC